MGGRGGGWEGEGRVFLFEGIACAKARRLKGTAGSVMSVGVMIANYQVCFYSVQILHLQTPCGIQPADTGWGIY